MFRFTIRDLLWLTVVVALGVAWWTQHRMTAFFSDQLYMSEQRLERIHDFLAVHNIGTRTPDGIWHPPPNPSAPAQNSPKD